MPSFPKEVVVLPMPLIPDFLLIPPFTIPSLQICLTPIHKSYAKKYPISKAYLYKQPELFLQRLYSGLCLQSQFLRVF